MLLGDCYMNKSSYRKAAVVYETAHGIYRSYYGPTHDKTSKAKAKLSDAQTKAKAPSSPVFSHDSKDRDKS